MNPILSAAGELQEFCSLRAWRFCFIGGLAVQRWGEPRNTQDADLTLLTGFGHEEPFVDELLTQFEGRRRDAKMFALQYRVLLLRAANGVPLDVALGAMPFEENSIARSSMWVLPEQASLQTCSAEDLIVHKIFAGRDRDWLDIEGVLLVQKGCLNLKQVREEVAPLLVLKEEPDSLRIFDKLCVKCGLESA
jgi:hypothetical protein